MIWPKGQKAFREDDVRAAGPGARLVDVKVVSVSERLSGLKMMVPVALREGVSYGGIRSSHLPERSRSLQKRVGFAGMGLMGSRMARNLLRRASRSRSGTARRSGASRWPRRARGSRARRASWRRPADVVVACVADPDAAGRVMFAEDGIRPAVRPGFRYLECSTISPGLVRRMGEMLRARDADVLEAPMTGSKLGAEKGTLLFMTGGRKETHEELMPVMMAMGTKAILCGELGQASVVKLIGNTMISFMLEGFCEGAGGGQEGGRRRCQTCSTS